MPITRVSYISFISPAFPYHDETSVISIQRAWLPGYPPALYWLLAGRTSCGVVLATARNFVVFEPMVWTVRLELSRSEARRRSMTTTAVLSMIISIYFLLAQFQPVLTVPLGKRTMV